MKTFIIQLFKISQQFVEKSSIALLQYAVTCHTISVANYHFTWYNVVINVFLALVSAVSFVT
jgi:hypothetical protein